MEMSEQDSNFIKSSYDSGIKYGYPQCCINEFIAKTPTEMKKSPRAQGELLRFEMAHIDGEYTGFIPCLEHAKQIYSKKITLKSLIDKDKRNVSEEFPNDWSLA